MTKRIRPGVMKHYHRWWCYIISLFFTPWHDPTIGLKPPGRCDSSIYPFTVESREWMWTLKSLASLVKTWDVLETKDAREVPHPAVTVEVSWQDPGPNLHSQTTPDPKAEKLLHVEMDDCNLWNMFEDKQPRLWFSMLQDCCSQRVQEHNPAPWKLKNSSTEYKALFSCGSWSMCWGWCQSVYESFSLIPPRLDGSLE